MEIKFDVEMPAVVSIPRPENVTHLSATLGFKVVNTYANLPVHGAVGVIILYIVSNGTRAIIKRRLVFPRPGGVWIGG